jgi:drug/metabolite transporter (DMT)-like permease
MKLRERGAFVLLGLIWGSSFLWIKLAVAEIGRFMLAAWRLLFGLLGLLVVMRLQGESFPRDRRMPLDWRLALGSLLIVAGIVVVNLQPRARAAAPAVTRADTAGRT